MNNTLACRGLSKSFTMGQTELSVLKAIDLTVQSGECVAIVGTSGSGKSTLLHCLGGLDVPTAGSVLIEGTDIYRVSEKKRCQLRNEYLGFVYQFHHLLPEFNALENISLPLLLRGMATKKAIFEARSILDKMGLANRAEHKVGELSGGERQRIAIARAIVGKPHCVLADEPTGNLDQQTAQHVFETLMELNREYKTSLIMVTHDNALAARMDRCIQMNDGCISEDTKV